MSSLFEFYHARELNGADGQVPFFQMPIDGGNGYSQIMGLQDMVEVLTGADAVRNDAIIFVKGFLVQRDSLP